MSVHGLFSILPERAASRARALILTALLLVLLTVLAAIIVRMWPMGTDYIGTFRPVTERFLNGQTRLYDSGSVGLYKAPWGLLYWIPLGWLPLNVSQVVQVVVILVSILFATHLLNGPKPVPLFAVFFAVGNLHTFEELIQLNMDTFSLLGLALGWWSIRHRRPWWLAIAFWLLALKPINVVLPALLFLIAIKGWPRREQGAALSVTALALLAAFPIIGWDWPVRYVRSISGFDSGWSMTVSLWRINEQLSLPDWPALILAALLLAAFLRLAWRRGLDEWTFSIAIATNLVITLYSMGCHYILLVPALVFVAQQSRTLALAAYLTTWFPLLRLLWGTEAVTIDFAYPVLLLAAGWYFALQAERGRATPQPLATQNLAP